MKLNLQPEQHYNQRNNFFDPMHACMPTAYVCFLEGNGIKWNNFSHLCDDDFVMGLMRSLAAEEIRNHKYPSLRNYPPNEIHGLYHSYVEPLLFGKKISDFVTNLTWGSIHAKLEEGQVVFTSGSFPVLPGHAFNIIGYDGDYLILSDPYGDYRYRFNHNKTGYGVKMNQDDFIKYVKNDPEFKWGHVLRG